MPIDVTTERLFVKRGGCNLCAHPETEHTGESKSRMRFCRRCPLLTDPCHVYEIPIDPHALPEWA